MSKQMSPAMERALGQTAVWNREAQKGYRGKLKQNTLDALVRRGWAKYADSRNDSIWLTHMGDLERLHQLDAAQAKIDAVWTKAEVAEEAADFAEVHRCLVLMQQHQDRVDRLHGRDELDLSERAQQVRDHE